MLRICLLVVLLAAGSSLISSTTGAEHELIPVRLDAATGQTPPKGFELLGDARFGPLGDAKTEISGHGVRLFSGGDINRDGQRAGSVAYTVNDLSPTAGRWYRFRVRGLAQEGFNVEQELLYLKVEFFKDHGNNSLDSIRKTVFAQVEQDRKSLADPGTNRQIGPATWRSFALEFRTPFPEVDALRLSAGFERGAGRGTHAEFWINDFELMSIADPADYAPRHSTSAPATPLALEKLMPLGGRWYFDPRAGDRALPAQFDASNADRLIYRSDRLETPFADNTTAWLRAGWVDLAGKMVNKDRFVPDNVVIRFTPTHLMMHSHNLPNHPTAVFPDRWRALDGNPNYIQEKDHTQKIPLEPRVNPNHIAMDDQNSNRALPGGPIGVAINGVVFFNPFDQGNTDAVWRLDRCCGHPGPMAEYHYHKYPVCVKSPWTDDGKDHSPVIGFAFDGFPVYGPYEAAGQLAKDSSTNPLNAFNGHEDAQRGWHYHVTPGKFPHLIGGFWGEAEVRNRPGPPPGGPMGPGGPPGPGGGFPPRPPFGPPAGPGF